MQPNAEAAENQNADNIPQNNLHISYAIPVLTTLGGLGIGALNGWLNGDIIYSTLQGGEYGIAIGSGLSLGASMNKTFWETGLNKYPVAAPLVCSLGGASLIYGGYYPLGAGAFSLGAGFLANSYGNDIVKYLREMPASVVTNAIAHCRIGQHFAPVQQV